MEHSVVVAKGFQDYLPARLRSAGLRLCCLGLVLASLLSSCTFYSRTSVDLTVTAKLSADNMALGNPSKANDRDPNNFFLSRPQYVLSYNRSHGIANWASWHLEGKWLGSGERPPFTTDPNLPGTWYQVAPQDYTGSGFDRGHLVPAADRNRSPNDSAAVFVMTNIFPQAPDNNRGPWEKLERYCRDLVKEGYGLYIVAGTHGTGGGGSRGRKEQLRGKVRVPAEVWKVIVVTDPSPENSSGNGSKVDAQTRVISVIMPNQQGIKEDDWQRFRVSVRDVETLTGYDFLSALPKFLQDQLETEPDRA
jgi:endonuclease G, mitochondrial